MFPDVYTPSVIIKILYVGFIFISNKSSLVHASNFSVYTLILFNSTIFLESTTNLKGRDFQWNIYHLNGTCILISFLFISHFGSGIIKGDEFDRFLWIFFFIISICFIQECRF